MHHRNAARFLPEPVGAQISVWSPPAICGQPCACAAVGSWNDDRNQLRVGSLKEARGSGTRAGTGAEYRTAVRSGARPAGSAAARRWLALDVRVDLREEVGQKRVELGRFLERNHVCDVRKNVRPDARN